MWRNSLPTIIQAEKSECGLACLAMILCYHGYKTDIGALRERFPSSQQGESIAGLADTATELQLSSRPMRIELEELSEIRLPAILHWDMNHFVVLRKISGNNYYVNDPALGETVLTKKEINQHFTGVVLELERSENFRTGDERKKLTIRHIWESSEGMTGITRGLSLSLLLSIFLLFFSLVLPFYSQIVIDEVAVNEDVQLLVKLAWGFLFITVTRVFTELIRSFLLLQLGSRLSFSFASGIYKRLLWLKSDYFLKRHIGDITSRFRSINNIREFISSGVVGIIVDGLLVVVTLVLMFFYSTSLTLVALIAVCIYSLIKAGTYKKIAQLNTGMLIETGKENTVFIENIRAIQGIKLFGREKERGSVWSDAYIGVINAGIKLQRNMIYIQSANNFLLGAGNVLLIFLGALAVLEQSLTIGMFIAYLQFKDQFYSRVFTLLDKVFEFKLLDVHLARLSDIVFAESEAEEASQYAHGDTSDDMPTTSSKTESLPPDTANPEQELLSVSNLSFRYSPGSPMLFDNVSFNLKAGEVIAITGPTGCGKSTLLKVLLSLLSPEQGSIKFRGTDITTLGVSRYRSQVAAILQDDSLISGTLLDNITFFDDSPDMSNATSAAQLAGIHDEINAMPMQYNTLVGNMGAALSGGQVQRIMLARAIYKGAHLLVTDEATSHLDLKKEEEVMNAFSRLNLARIIVAHRPNSILRADRILELTPRGLVAVNKADFKHATTRFE